MQIPESFQRQLASEFGGQIRARWSRAKDRVVIERKSARGREDSLLPPMPSLTKVSDPLKRRALALRFEERLEQARSGYYPILEVCPGDRTKCPGCGRTVKVPIMQWRSARCSGCRKEFTASHWPLSDALLQHLRWSDPDRGGIERVAASITDGETAVEKAARRKLANHTEDVWKDAFTHVFDIPSVGYTGRERYGR